MYDGFLMGKEPGPGMAFLWKSRTKFAEFVRVVALAHECAITFAIFFSLTHVGKNFYMRCARQLG
jgi:hypothetical protein